MKSAYTNVWKYILKREASSCNGGLFLSLLLTRNMVSAVSWFMPAQCKIMILQSKYVMQKRGIFQVALADIGIHGGTLK